MIIDTQGQASFSSYFLLHPSQQAPVCMKRVAVQWLRFKKNSTSQSLTSTQVFVYWLFFAFNLCATISLFKNSNSNATIESCNKVKLVRLSSSRSDNLSQCIIGTGSSTLVCRFNCNVYKKSNKSNTLPWHLP